MTKYYSKINHGFYDSEVHSTLPPDAQAIPDDQYVELLEAQSMGRVIFFNGDEPIAIDEAELLTESTDEQLWQEIRVKRNQLLKDSDFSQLLDIQSSLSDEQKQAWVEYRETLRNITNMYENPKDLIFPDIPTV